MIKIYKNNICVTFLIQRFSFVNERFNIINLSKNLLIIKNKTSNLSFKYYHKNS